MLNSIFVVLGAALWATDTLFRHPMTNQISAVSLVFLEHLFALLIASIWIFFFEKKKFKLDPLPLAGAALIGILGSALATVLFTLSFQFVNPSISILLQKVQPLVVIGLSWVFLGEKLSFQFFTWAALAIVAAFFLSFPHGMASVQLEEGKIEGVLLALGAALLWSVSTVIGKFTLKKISSLHLTFWRFLFGMLMLWVLLESFSSSKGEIPLVTMDGKIMTSIFFMALIPGFLGVALYYRGLTRLKASVATLLELSFPLSAVFINSRYLDLHLEGVQLFSAAILLFSIYKISKLNSQKN
jgi:drug/metabolite transporter (DMT)-like permease